MSETAKYLLRRSDIIQEMDGGKSAVTECTAQLTTCVKLLVEVWSFQKNLVFCSFSLMTAPVVCGSLCHVLQVKHAICPAQRGEIYLLHSFGSFSGRY